MAERGASVKGLQEEKSKRGLGVVEAADQQTSRPAGPFYAKGGNSSIEKFGGGGGGACFLGGAAATAWSELAGGALRSVTGADAAWRPLVRPLALAALAAIASAAVACRMVVLLIGAGAGGAGAVPASGWPTTAASVDADEAEELDPAADELELWFEPVSSSADGGGFGALPVGGGGCRGGAERIGGTPRVRWCCARGSGGAILIHRGGGLGKVHFLAFSLQRTVSFFKSTDTTSLFFKHSIMSRYDAPK